MKRYLLSSCYVHRLAFLSLALLLQIPAGITAQSVTTGNEKDGAVTASVAARSGHSPVQHPFGKGDAFRIYVSPDTASFLNGTYPIDDDGYVFLPIIGRIKADTMSAGDFYAIVDSVYMPFLRHPNILIQPLIRVSLLGGFHKPGLYYISPSASLWDAVAVAGGPAREDGLKKIKWEHNGETVKEHLLADIEKGTSLKNLGFASGDQLRVTRLPKMEAWETFRTELLPVLSLTISAISASATMYVAYQAFKGR
ncbi:MAG: hypothetical protein JXA71_13230 [Chitinispirillaceae bacterium]|nr:hypothetical protein [Chitinispirillaceae bacterium]